VNDKTVAPFERNSFHAPSNPVQRGFTGGLWGAASGAAIGAAAGGGPGAALGAAVGGATGIFGGVASTPPPPPGTYYGYPAYGYFPGYGYWVTVIPPIDTHPTCRPATDIQFIPVLPVTPVPRPMDTRETGDTPVIPLRRAMDTKAAKETPLTPVPRPMNTMAMRVTRPTRLAISPKATEHTRPTLVPPAVETRGIWEKPRCRRLRTMNTRTRRRLPLTPFPIIDHRRSSSAAPDRQNRSVTRKRLGSSA
jgi:hypothetical protein